MSEPNPIRVLIAEDHLIARVGLTTIINAQPGMKVVGEATNGQKAVELHRQHRPDVTLMDIRMPVLDGISAIAAIRSEAPAARIVALSTYGGDQDVRRALEAGAQAYLTKEVLHDELVKAIHAVLAGRTYLPSELAAALASQMPGHELTARELDVLGLIVRGFSNRQISAELAIAEYTVKNHVKNILGKLGVEDRTQAATTALQRGIIHLS